MDDEIGAWVKFAADAAPGDIWLSMQRTAGGTPSFDTVARSTGVTAGEWRQVSATYQMPEADSAFLYIETDYPSGTTASFLVDDVVI